MKEMLKPVHNDWKEVRRLAEIIWNNHYPSIIGRQQIDYMLELMYSFPALEMQTQNGHRFFFIVYDTHPRGFISYSQQHNQGIIIHKFYVLPGEQGSGLGTRTLNALLVSEKPKEVTLTVNRKNFKSINFYFKNGFRINRVVDIDIGNGFVMNDFEMIWKKPVSRTKPKATRL